MSDRVTDDLLTADLRRVGELVGGPPTVRQYREHGSYGDGQVRMRLGGWPGALEKAFGADPRLIVKPESAEAPRETPRVLTANAPVGHSSRVIAIVSDIHFDLHDEPTWFAFREWHTHAKPKHTVILGDFVDLGMMSRYEQGPEEPVYAIPQIQMFVREATALLAECEVLTICMGNHDERWQKFIGATRPAVLKGAIGLTLREQCEAQGLERSSRVQWFSESNDTPALMVAGYALHHGHNKSGKWGGPKHLAASLLDKGNGQSQIVGHSHRAQLFMRGAFGRVSIGIANPAMCRPMTYANDPDWQRGWTVLEMMAPDYQEVTPHVLLSRRGVVSWGGRTYGVRSAA